MRGSVLMPRSNAKDNDDCIAAVNVVQGAGMRFGQHVKENPMNWNRIEGNWKQLKGVVKEQWGKLTDDQLDVIAGKRDQLAGKIQETYGVSKDEVEKQISHWEKRLK